MTPADPSSDRPATPQVIQGYGNGGFTVSGAHYDGAVIVLRTRTALWSPPDDLSRLTVADFAAVTDSSANVDIVLLGCGKRAILLNGETRAALKASGITVECMETGAACRTFNLLQMEGRRVAAMLVALS